MNNQSNKTTSVSLLFGSFLMFVTMILHPGKGGLTQGLVFAIVSHSLAISSVPFSAIGFFGLSKVLDDKQFLSRIGLAIMILGLFAAVMAATLNGLVLPIYVWDFTPEMVKESKNILGYARALNHGFDYILIASMFVSTAFWSIAILQLKVLPKWLGYLGIGLFTIGLAAIISGFYFLDVTGFRIMIYGWVIWIVAVGVNIYRLK